MMSKINQIGNQLLNSVSNMGREEWIFVFLAAVAIGCFCLKGFGSRNNY